MRKEFAKQLYRSMSENEDIYLLTGDLGYKMFDHIRESFPKRFINCQAAEQTMMGIAVGLALSGKIPFVYTISPFLLRAYETINIYLEHEKANVKLIGSGRNNDYSHDGFSHLETGLPFDIKKHYPEFDGNIKIILELMISRNEPEYLNLKR
jgi:transketolase